MGMSLILERPNYAAMDLSDAPILQIDETRRIEHEEEHEDGALETVCIDLPMYSEDQISHAPLIEFIGQTNYNYIFETPI